MNKFQIISQKWKDKILGIIEFFKSKQSTGAYSNNVDIFNPIDVPKVAKELELEKRGEIDGQSNKPISESLSNNDIENRIISIIERERHKNYEVAGKEFAAYYERIKSLSIDVNVNQLEIGEKKITTDIRAVLNNSKTDLYKIQNDIEKKENEIKRFKSSNMLSREPDYNDNKIRGYAVIAILFFTEIGLNAYFFAQGNSLGYLGGISQAFIIAVINIILFGFLIGWIMLREIEHVKKWRKLVGYISIVLLILLVPAFNLLLAHYRQASIQQAVEPGMVALKTFMASPFNLYDFDSCLLILFGIAIIVWVILKFWKINDHYPGYESLDKKLNELQKEYTVDKENLVTDLISERDEGFSVIKNAVKELALKQDDYRMLFTKMEHIKSQLESYLTGLEQSGRELLSMYREANESTRNTPSPARWQNEYTITPSRMDSFQMPPFHDVSEIVEKMRKSLPDIINTINNECSSAMAELELIRTTNNGNKV